jgi:NhaA family Na+:H+ antiporter
MVFNRLKFRSLFFYLVPGIFIWYFIHHSGIHATIAGVITAFTLPVSNGTMESPLERLEHLLNKPVNFLIMPLFALANTNIRIEGNTTELLTGTLGLGIIAGLIVGKPIGILLLSWLTVKLKWSMLPARSHWGHIFGLGLLGGIGFTMSVFIALLSFSDPQLIHTSKISILFASAFSGIAGYLVLFFMKKKRSITNSSRVSG